MSSSSNSDLRWYPLWLAAGWFWIIVVCYLSLTTSPIDTRFGVQVNDKLGHVLAYFWLMSWFGLIFVALRRQIVIAGLFVMMGIVLEFMQYAGGARQYEFMDMLANFAGVVAGLIISRQLPVNIFTRIENYFLPRI